MNTPGEHGRQPTPQATPLTDPRMRNVPANPTPTTTALSVTESSGICRDYLWGICTMNKQCIYRHDLEFEAMKETLKFCHDHQNRTGCTRPDCTYLHTSRDEENLFLTTGQIPRMLLDRYAKMSVKRAKSVPPKTPKLEIAAQPPPATTLPAHSGTTSHSSRQTQQQQKQPQPTTTLPAHSGTTSHSPRQTQQQQKQPPPATTLPAHSGTMSNSPRQTQQQQKQATKTINPIQGPIQGPMPNPIQGPMQGPIPATMTSPIPGPMHSPIQGPIPAPMTSPMPGPMQGPKQSPMQGPKQGPIQGPKQGPMQGPKQGPVQGPKQGPMQGPKQGPMQGPKQDPMQGPMQHPKQGPMTGSALMQQVPAPLQPPPPPPPPPTSSVSSIKMSGPVYTGGHHASSNPVSAHYQANNNQQSLPALFDPTRPPPPIFQNSSTLKRTAEDCEVSAGPSKLRKTDAPNESSCEKCSRRLLRLQLYSQETEQVKKKNEIARAEYAARAQDFERKKRALQSILRPEVYRLTEDYIESKPNQSNNSSTATFLDTILGMIVGRDVEPTPAASDAMFLQQLNLRIRPPTTNGTSTDILTSLFDMVRNSPAERNSSESRSADSPVVNGLARSFSESGPSTSRLYESAGPSMSRLYESPGPSSSRPFEGAVPSPSRISYDSPGPSPACPYDGAVGSTTYMSMAPFEPVRYPPPTPASTPPVALMAMPQGARPVPMPSVQISGPGPYGSQQTHLQAQGPPSRAPFYVQTPTYNGANLPYPGMMLQQQRAGRPQMQPHQNPPSNFFFGTRYPNFYPPYQ